MAFVHAGYKLPDWAREHPLVLARVEQDEQYRLDVMGTSTSRGSTAYRNRIRASLIVRAREWCALRSIMGPKHASGGDYRGKVCLTCKEHRPKDDFRSRVEEFQSCIGCRKAARVGQPERVRVVPPVLAKENVAIGDVRVIDGVAYRVVGGQWSSERGLRVTMRRTSGRGAHRQVGIVHYRELKGVADAAE